MPMANYNFNHLHFHFEYGIGIDHVHFLAHLALNYVLYDVMNLVELICLFLNS